MPATFDIAELLQPIAGEAPAGVDLEYTAEFAALQVAAAGKPEQQLGSLIVPAAEPDWRAVAGRAAELLTRSHDLRIACRLAQAWLHVGGLQGLAAGLALVRAYVEHEWGAVYPRLDPDDGHDPAIRVNALALLCNVAAIIHPLRERPLLRSTLAGAISLRAITQAHGGESSPDAEAAAPGAADIDAAFATMAFDELASMVAAARRAQADAACIETELMIRVGAARALDFGPLTKALGDIDAVAGPWLARRQPEAAPADVQASADTQDATGESFDDVSIADLLAALDDAGAGAGDGEMTAPAAPLHAAEPRPEAVVATPPPAAPAEAARGALRNRDDVLRALAEMCRYFAQHEPGHPVPILLERAQRWIAMDYMALLRDLAPEAADQAERLRGASHQAL